MSSSCQELIAGSFTRSSCLEPYAGPHERPEAHFVVQDKGKLRTREQAKARSKAKRIPKDRICTRSDALGNVQFQHKIIASAVSGFVTSHGLHRESPVLSSKRRILLGAPSNQVGSRGLQEGK